MATLLRDINEGWPGSFTSLIVVSLIAPCKEGGVPFVVLATESRSVLASVDEPL